MIASNINYSTFIEYLISEIPQIKDIYNEHINDYDELLMHVLFGDITRFAVSLYKKNSNDETLKKLLLILDEGFTTSDKKLQELISVSFLENLDQSEDYYNGIKDMLSNRLRNELILYED